MKANVALNCAPPVEGTADVYRCTGTSSQEAALVVNCYDRDVKKGGVCNATALGPAAHALVRPYH